VISPLISNLYLHYAFDKWMEKHHKEIVFERFADDIIVHCMSQEKAESLLTEIRARLQACGLTLHPIKTKIVYCKTTNRKKQYQQVTFDFLGMSFKPKVAKNRKSGVLFTTYGPAAISKKSVRKIIDTIKSKYLTKRVTVELKQLAPLLAPHVRGWINYFGKVNLRLLYKVMKYLNGQLLKWTMKRFKRFRGRIKAARNWLKKICKENPNMFVHWQYGFYP
nr:group II intron reverse transcriptase/maturase [Flammeovirgaceae bacterium]